MTCSFSHHGVPPLSEVVATTAYRITQEALTNIVRHAAATQVEISLDYENEVLTLAIRDNGRGFDIGHLEGCKGLGIAGMRERASLVNGRLIIQSQPGQGSEVYFQLGGDLLFEGLS
jgi:signal transduction histidine kinase